MPSKRRYHFGSLHIALTKDDCSSLYYYRCSLLHHNSTKRGLKKATICVAWSIETMVHPITTAVPPRDGRIRAWAAGKKAAAANDVDLADHQEEVGGGDGSGGHRAPGPLYTSQNERLWRRSRWNGRTGALRCCGLIDCGHRRRSENCLGRRIRTRWERIWNLSSPILATQVN